MSGVDHLDYLLGEMDPEDRERAERMLAEDAAFRDEVDTLGPVVAALQAMPADAWDLPEVPPLQHPDAEPVAVAADEPPSTAPRRERRPWWRLSIPVPALAVASVIALTAGVGIGVLVAGGDEQSPVPTTVADVPLAALTSTPNAPSGDARILSDGELSIDVRDLPSSAQRELYGLWLLGKDGRLLPLGSFRVPKSGVATVTVPLPVNPEEFDYVDISVEPDDGNPGHSGDSVLRGPTA